MAVVKYALASGKELMIGTANVDKCYDLIKELYPEAKLSKHNGYVLVEK